MLNRCDGCAQIILTGGTKVGDLRFCTPKCASNAVDLIDIDQHSLTLPEKFLEAQVLQVFEGPCPRCGITGGVDLYEAHWVWSILVMTQWKTTGGLSCQGCATKARIYALLVSSTCGWWGFPWGIFMTPLQILRNLAALMEFSRTEPSTKLVQHIRRMLAAQDLRERQAASQNASATEVGSPSREEQRV